MRKILLFLLLLALVPVAQADITVGVDYESLNEAIENAKVGDTIRIPAGVYPAGVSVDKRVTIIGEGDSVLLANGSMSTISVTADDVIIDGVTFAPSYTGVTVSGNGVSVKNCFFVENLIGVDAMGDGIYVTGCDFTGCGYAGISAESVDGARIGGNIFNTCHKALIISFSDSSGVVDNIIHDSDIGIVLEGVYNSSFSGNQFDGCNTSISLVDSGWNTFTDHMVEDGVFLELDNCVGNIAEDNVVDGVYVVQRYSSENRYLFNGITVTGDMFSVSVVERNIADYVLLSDVLVFEMLPDPVFGGEWVTVDVDIYSTLAENAIPGTLGLYAVNSMDLLESLSQNGSRLIAGLTLDEDVTFGCLMQVDTSPPVAVINAPQIGQVGDVFYLDAGDSSDNTGIVDYEWNLGDGSTATGVIAQHYYSAPGEYTVTLNVADASGQMDSATHNITIIIDEEPEAPVTESNQMLWVALIIILGAACFYLYSRREQLG